MNDPFMFNWGANFNMIVNFCDVAASNMQQTDPACETDRLTIWNYIKNVSVSSKVVRQAFDPKLYLETKQLQYIGERRIMSDLIENMSSWYQFSLKSLSTKFYTSMFLDLSTVDLNPLDEFQTVAAMYESL